MTDVTAAELVHAILQQASIDSTGNSNQQRLQRIVAVFKRDGIALDEDYPFEEAVHCNDPKVVQAMIDLATIQHQYKSMQIAARHITADEGDRACIWLDLNIIRMEWHLKHLNKGGPTPACPVLN